MSTKEDWGSEMEEQWITVSLERYTELIRNEQKYAQYKQYLINSSTNKGIEFMKAVERKNMWDIIEGNKESEVK